MNYLQAIILGVVEGITEYLPVSSTAHLLLASHLMGLADTLATHAYLVVIQGGAIVAVLFLYRARFWQLAAGVVGRDKNGLALLINLLIAFLPAAVIGALFNKKIEEYLFGLWPVVVAWLLGGAVILLLPKNFYKAKSTMNDITWRQALLIGLAQCLAMWPGVSRSLATMLGGLAVGLALPMAIEFSFLLGVGTLSAATVFELVKNGQAMVSANDWQVLAVGFVVSFLTAVAAVKWLVEYLQTHRLNLFAWWRLGLGLLVAVGLMTHIL